MPQMSASALRLASCTLGLAFAAFTQAASDSRPAVPSLPGPDGAVAEDAELPDTAFVRGLTALKAKRFEEARLLFQYAARNISIRVNPLGWLTAQFNACHTLCLQGKNDEAETLARSLTATCEAELGIEDPLTSEALAYLAFVLKNLGHEQDAEPVYRRTVQVLESKYGLEHPQVATAMTKHAALLDALGQHTDAEKIHRRAVAVMEKTGQTDSGNLCIFVTNLAFCLHSQNKSDEAHGLMEKAYQMVQATEDDSLQSAGTILRKQTEFYREHKQLDRAESLGRRSLLRLARRPEINRARFFYYDIVAGLYRSVLKARGLNDDDIVSRIQRVQNEASASKTTASVLR